MSSLKRALALNDAEVIANGEEAAKLAGEGIAATTLDGGAIIRGAFALRAIPVAHEPILAESLPRITAFAVNDQILNTADLFQESLLAFAGIEGLALPVMESFLTELTVMDFARGPRP